MTKNLRRKHILIWRAWAFLLPLCMILAWWQIPALPQQSLLQPGAAPALPLELIKKESEQYSVAIRSNTEGTQLQLEWKNKTVLTHPTAAIYISNNASSDIDKARLVGRIEARGDYYFPLDSTIRPERLEGYHLLLYDFIHRQIIDKIKF